MTSAAPKYAWMNGEIIPWEDAKVHVRTDAFTMGASVFEGMRAYAGPGGGQLYLIKSAEHMDRLFNTSMKILRMKVQWLPSDLIRATCELIRANELHEDTFIRVSVYFGMGENYAFDPARIEIGCVITAVPARANPRLSSGINVCVSSWRRLDDQSMPPRVKAAANYMHSRYVRTQATVDGYDSAVILDQHGKVSEGPIACLMMVRNGNVVTPPVTANILESVTRSSIIDLFRDELGMDVLEREIDRTELYIADEIFFCGTFVEVQPIVSIDRYHVGTGEPGPIVRKMQDLYFGIVRGQNPRYRTWLEPVC